MQVVFQDIDTDFIESSLNSIHLANDIDAVGFIFNHPLHTPNMSFNRFKPV
jgi:hypothetical protein